MQKLTGIGFEASASTFHTAGTIVVSVVIGNAVGKTSLRINTNMEQDAKWHGGKTFNLV